MFAASASSVTRPEPTIDRTAASRLPSSCRTVAESETSFAISSSWPRSESVRVRSSVTVSTRPPVVSLRRRLLPSGDAPVRHRVDQRADPGPPLLVEEVERLVEVDRRHDVALGALCELLRVGRADLGQLVPGSSSGLSGAALVEDVQVGVAEEAALADLDLRVLVDRREVVVQREGDDALVGRPRRS